MDSDGRESMRPLVALVGPTGAGRSSVGRALAAELDCPLTETEDLLPAPVSELVLSDPEQASELIIAAGREQLVCGGVVTLLPSAAMDVQLLEQYRQQNVPLVYLSCDISELARRANLGAPRTTALGTPRAMFAHMVRDFEEAVTQQVQLVVPTGGSTPEQVAATIRDTMAQDNTTTE